jgi:hypothetical protein
MDGFETVRSYSELAAEALREAASEAGRSLYQVRHPLPYDLFLEHVPSAHLSFFEGLTAYYQAADGICVHGGLDPNVPHLQDQRIEALIWGASGFPEQYRGGEIVAYGHRNNAELDLDGWPRPRIIGTTIGLDSISHGVLTALRLRDRQVFQSRRYLVS